MSLASGYQLDFTTDPVVEAQDANGVKDTDFTDTVTLSETGAGTTTYTATANAESVALQADDTAGGAEGDVSTLPISSSIVTYALNTDGTLTAGSAVSEPVVLPSTATTTGVAVDLFDFAITDGGT